MIPDSNIHAVIHLSSTAVYTIVGYFDTHHKKTKVMALGVANTDAFFGGQIVNRQHLLSAIYKSLREAVDMAGLEMSYVGLSFATPNMVSDNDTKSKSIINKENPAVLGRIITHDDVQEILESVEWQVGQKGHSVMQLCQQLFWLNDDQNAKDVAGMIARKLSISYHCMSIPSVYHAQMQDLLKSNNLEVHPMLFDGVVGAEYTLSMDEKKRGVCFIDIGAGTTKVCLYNDGILIFSKCIDMGGQVVDMDIASVLQLTLLEAESLKRQHGSAFAQTQNKSDFITLKKRHQETELTVHLYKLASIIEARYLAILNEIFDEIYEKNLDGFMDMGVVLAGGASNIADLPLLIEQHFGVSVRKMQVNKSVSVCTERLSNDHIKLLRTHIQDPKFHSVIGALMYYQSEQYARDEHGQLVEVEKMNVFERLWQYCQDWLERLKKMI